MASLVLSGDTSGSVTLAAPAVAGSTTQTLVNVTGTLAPVVSGTAITLTNQTEVEFTSIPLWVKRITLTFSGVSTNGTAPPLIQIGSGSYATSGYLGSNSIVGVSAVVSVLFTTGFGIGVNTANWTSSFTANGAITLSLHKENTWVCSGSISNSAAAATYLTSGSSEAAISGSLDRVRLYINGTQQFDAGTINILYE
jgi:hypothetical protein